MNDLLLDRPRWLLALWLLVPLAWLLLRAERRRVAAAHSFAAPVMAATLIPPLGGPRSWWRAIVLLVGLASLAIAAAGPRFGVTFEQAHQRGADLLVVLDVSKSMLSEDVAPNRLERAKSDIRDLVERVVGHRLGLVVFAGKAVLACPLTTDRGFFRDALARVDSTSSPRGGTAIGDGIRMALQSLPTERDRDQALVVITDGEDHDSFPLDAAKLAAERGVRIFTVGLGDPGEGARVPLAGDDGSRTFLKHDGAEVWSKMQEPLLTELATTTGGAYVPARTSAYDLGAIYEKHLAQLAAGDIQSEKRKRLTPRFQLFVALGLLLLLIERLITPARRKSERSAPLAAVTSALLVALAAFALGGAARASDAVQVARDVREGVELMAKGNANDALSRFEAAAAAEPENLAIVFNLGCAKQAKSDLDGARADLLRVAAGHDGALAVKARFNLGTVAIERAKLALGEKPEEAEGEARTKATAAIEEAIGHFRACLAAAPDHTAARGNLEKLRVWMKHMEDAWARHDREKRRDEMDVLQYLDWLHESQGGLRAAARAASREPDSPLRRTLIDALVRQEKELRDEIPHLKEKLAKLVQEAAGSANAAAPGGAPGSAPGGAAGGGNAPPAVDPAQLEQALRSIMSVVDDADQQMATAGTELAAGRFTEVDQAGRVAQERFDGLWLGLGDFGGIVQRGVKLASSAVEQLKPFVAVAPAAPSTTAPTTPPPSDVPPLVSTDPEAQLAIQELDERVAVLAEALTPHAEAMQQQLAQQPLPPASPETGELAPPDESTPPPLPPLTDDPNATPPDAPGAPVDPDAPAAPDPAAQRAALERACAKALENGPKIAELEARAPKQLLADAASAAAPDQEEALRLLREIENELPKSEQKQDQKQDDKQEQQQPKDDPQEPKPDDAGKQDEKDKEQEKPDPKEQKDGGQKPGTPPKITPEQAQALLRRAVERAREKNEEQKKAEQAVLVPGRVDRDW